MRWDALQLHDPAEAGAADGGAGSGAPGPAAPEPLPLLPRGAVARTFDTPQFRGMTFYEVQARSVLNRVPEASAVPFRWTVNPYRGCSHACVYCFARGTHAYLELGTGLDFDRKVVVKTNAAEVLRRELARPRWAREHVAMGTNVDCYQRAEGRYRLMPGILRALTDARTPFSVLTKGTLVLRDLPLLQEAAQVVPVATNVSVGFLDEDLWRLLEPGTPSPRRRLEVCARLNDAGVPCGVLMAPVVPGLSDSPAEVERTVRAIADAGATHVTPLLLHLRPGAREWFLAWLDAHHPRLRPLYDRLYGRGAYAPRAYQDEVRARVLAAAERCGLGGAGPRRSRRLGYGVAALPDDAAGRTGADAGRPPAPAAAAPPAYAQDALL
ncbi:Rv2578c family radical SAM protein [Vallicoccus soli]|uniref:Radical SAM protein n=1 Tax=Vallicoccus soli TaxID=2339232 RepID=A0A3A3Z6G7_9ACTN|nr:Rv2578c family radical SAM protein [Vallicoccus soli]RJK96295.1 radical SAM protein [Vallicoccus soli]